jgi:hypothetical protein
MRRACVRCLRSFSLFSGLEWRWSGGFASCALVRAQALVDTSRRSRGLNLAVVQARFACRQLRLGGVRQPAPLAFQTLGAQQASFNVPLRYLCLRTRFVVDPRLRERSAQRFHCRQGVRPPLICERICAASYM